MVQFLGFDWSIVEVITAVVIAGVILCLLVHLLAAACGWDNFFSCYGACGRAIFTCCGLRTSGRSTKEEEMLYEGEFVLKQLTRRQSRRGQRRAGDSGGGGGGGGGGGKQKAGTEPVPTDPEPSDGASDRDAELPLLPFTVMWSARV